MKLLVLGPNYSGRISISEKYKGVQRIENPYPVVSKNKELADSVFEEIENHIDYLAPDGEYITDINLAEKAAKIYTECAEIGQWFSVFEITYPFEPPKIKKIFLGYDVLLGSESMIAYIFGSNMNLIAWQEEIKHSFEGELNDSLLFSNIIIAFDFFKKVNEFQYDLDSSIVGIYE